MTHAIIKVKRGASALAAMNGAGRDTSGKRASSPVLLILIPFLCLLNVLNFADRLLPTSLGKQIEDSLGIQHEALGLLSGFHFVLTYTAASLVFGLLADRWRRKTIIVIGLLLWGGMTALSGLVQNFGQIVAARMIFGVGQAALTPAALSLIADVVAPRRKAFATGVYYAGLPLGVGLSLMVASEFEPLLGWRGCFVALGVLTMAMAMPALLLKTGGESRPHHRRDDSPGQVLELLKLSTHSRPMLLTLAGSICIVFMSAAGNLRMVWLQAERGFDVTIGMTAGLIYMSGGITGNLIGGWLGDRFEQWRHGGRLLFIAWSQLFITPVILLSYILTPDSQWFYIAWFGAILGTTLYYGPAYSAIQDMVPSRMRASAVGLLIFSVNLLGVGPGPWLAGALGDRLSLTAGLAIASSISFLAFPFFLGAYAAFRKTERCAQ